MNFKIGAVSTAELAADVSRPLYRVAVYVGHPAREGDEDADEDDEEVGGVDDHVPQRDLEGAHEVVGGQVRHETQEGEDADEGQDGLGEYSDLVLLSLHEWFHRFHGVGMHCLELSRGGGGWEEG